MCLGRALTSRRSAEPLALSTISRISCPKCGTDCMEQEVTCWQCGSALRPRPEQPRIEEELPESTEAVPSVWSKLWRRPPPAPPRIINAEDLIQFEGSAAPEPHQEPAPESAQTQTSTRTATLLTGEVVEIPVEERAPVPTESVPAQK